MTDEYITDHPYTGELRAGASCQHMHRKRVPQGEDVICGQQAMDHANPGPTHERHLLHTHPHNFVPQPLSPGVCDYRIDLGGTQICGYPEQLHHWAEADRYTAGKAGVGDTLGPKWNGEYQKRTGDIIRTADQAQYERPPMPDAARKGPVVTLLDAPVDPLGTLAVIGGIYTGKVRRSKAEATDEDRRAMLADMQATVLNGPLESIQFTFLVEGVGRDITHQMVRNRFSFFAQESLRFAVAEDWAQEVPLPPSLTALPQDSPAVGVWRKALNAAEDSYAALIGAGMPAEEARKVLPHAITTRLYWTVSLRTLLQEAGKRTCTQAQFDWRQIFGGVAKALRERSDAGDQTYSHSNDEDLSWDGWQYAAFADLLRPVCYQDGKCTFMASFDRGCTIRERVDAFDRAGVPSSEWHRGYAGKGLFSFEGQDAEGIPAIDPAEWATDPSAARVVGE